MARIESPQPQEVPKMATVDERISALKEKLKQEKEKKANIEARKRAAEAKKSRADATRKKVLIGTMIQARVALGRLSESKLDAMMDEHLTRANDRVLFGLPAIPTPSQKSAPHTDTE
jgi:membrane protein involved in colicin uptake